MCVSPRFEMSKHSIRIGSGSMLERLAAAPRAPRRAARGGARSAAGPGRARAARCARPARRCGACRRARRGAPRPARRGARSSASSSTSVLRRAPRGTITCGGIAGRGGVVLEHELLGHLGLVARRRRSRGRSSGGRPARRRAPGTPARSRRVPSTATAITSSVPTASFEIRWRSSSERTALQAVAEHAPPARTPGRSAASRISRLEVALDLAVAARQEARRSTRCSRGTPPSTT